MLPSIFLLLYIRRNLFTSENNYIKKRRIVMADVDLGSLGVAAETVQQIALQSPDKPVNIITGSKKKITASKGKLNVFISDKSRDDLINSGWLHRGIVGANIYFKEG